MTVTSTSDTSGETNDATSDETTDTQESTTTAPEAGTEDTNTNDTDDDKVTETLRKIRSERDAARKAAKDLETRLKAIEDKDLDEKTKLEREVADLRAKTEAFESEAAERTARKVLTAAARKAGAHDRPERVARLIALTDLDVDDETAVKAAIKSVRDEYPELFPKTGPGDAGAGKGSATASDPNAAFRAALLGR